MSDVMDRCECNGHVLMRTGIDHLYLVGVCSACDKRIVRKKTKEELLFSTVEETVQEMGVSK